MRDVTRRWLAAAGSIRVRITLVAAAVTAAAVALTGWLVVRSVENTQLAELRELAEQSVSTAADRLDAGDTFEVALRDLPTIVLVTDTDGNCVSSAPLGGGVARTCPAGAGAPGAAGPVAVPGVAPGTTSAGAIPPDDRNTIAGGVFTGEPLEIVTRSVVSPRYGPVEVRSPTPADEIARSVASVRRALRLLFPGLVAVVAVVAWWLTGRTLRPVDALRAEAEAIGGASLHRRVPEPATDDEVGRLARTMNAMLGRLERSAQRQHEFVSDASHELRTPLTSIRADIEVALAEADRADWRAVAESVLEEEARLEAILRDLLLLATDDEAGAAGARSTDVDLAELVVVEARRSRQVAVSVEQQVGAEPGSFVVSGVATRLQRAFGNLLDNACRHAATSVTVTVRVLPGRVLVDVDDDGPGVAVQDRERIFERFARLGDDRSRDRGGAGLGLAVTRSIVTRHGGTVSAGDSVLGGARFTIDLPQAASTTDRR